MSCQWIPFRFWKDPSPCIWDPTWSPSAQLMASFVDDDDDDDGALGKRNQRSSERLQSCKKRPCVRCWVALVHFNSDWDCLVLFDLHKHCALWWTQTMRCKADWDVKLSSVRNTSCEFKLDCGKTSQQTHAAKSQGHWEIEETALSLSSLGV